MTPVMADTVVNIDDYVEITEDASVVPVEFTVTTDVDYGPTDHTILADSDIIDDSTARVKSIELLADDYERTYVVNFAIEDDMLWDGFYHTVDVEIHNVLNPTPGDTGTMVASETLYVFVVGEETPAAPLIIDDIDFDDETYPEGTVEVEVTLETQEIRFYDDDPEVYEDVTIEVWAEDYTGERLTDKEKTGEFNIGKFNDDDKRTKTLTLEIPDDADEGEYFIVVRVEGEWGGRKGLLALDMWNELTVERNDHNVKVLDFIYDDDVEAGESADFAVLLLNNGREDEAVKVKVSIVGLDISQTSEDIEIQVDEYAPVYFSMAIPEYADEDDYLVKLTVYNDEIDFDETYDIEVSEDAGFAPGIGGLAIGADATSKQIGAEGGVYLISLTNNEAAIRTFTMEVTGASTWADYSINPATVTVAPGTSQIVSVYVSPDADTSGTQAFTLNVKEGATVVDSLGLTAQVSESQDITSMITSSLQWLVAILIVVAIVLGIAWAFTREAR
jgi:hypothetical protein